jgi:hypothetical protein
MIGRSCANQVQTARPFLLTFRNRFRLFFTRRRSGPGRLEATMVSPPFLGVYCRLGAKGASRENFRQLFFLSSVFFHDRDISVGLICNHLPASPEARQNRSLGSALSRKHKAITIFGLSPTTTRFVGLPLGAKKGQWRPAKYTRLKRSNPRALRLQCLSRLERASARLEAWSTLRDRRERDTLCHRISAYGSAVITSI